MDNSCLKLSLRGMMPNLRATIIAFVLISHPAIVMAERNNLKPTDFEPLTSLPWKRADATLDNVLDTIFREPNPAIRYPVLAAYLRVAPVEQLSKAFDICVTLEGTQTPDQLVEFFLPIWAKRDPQACWKRIKLLFEMVGIEGSWLGYDSWKKRPRITVQNWQAIRASRFWLERSSSLIGFGNGVDASSLPRKQRVQLMKVFVDRWFRGFGSWPGYMPVKRPWQCSGGYDDSDHDLIQMFGASAEQLRSYATQGHYSYHEPAVEIALRRWLKAEPGSALEIMRIIPEIKWTPSGGSMPSRAAEASTELLIIWAKADLPGMIRWADSFDIRKGDVALRAKGLLMSRVDAGTRERWLADVKSARPEDDLRMSLLSDWAVWDPKPALEAAVATQDAETIREVANRAAYGPQVGQTWNTSHFGLGVIKDFDVASLPEGVRKDVIREGWETIMEQWGDIDIGEAARYGVEFLLRTGYAPRDRLIKFFSGHDEYPDEGGMIDRTFCALRVWAVVQPKEMKAWISTLRDAEMRKALTWLLQNPRGTGAIE